MTQEHIPPRQRSAERKVLRTARYLLTDRIISNPERRDRTLTTLIADMRELEVALGHSALEEYR